MKPSWLKTGNAYLSRRLRSGYKTEENLRAVLQSNGASLEDFTEAEREQVLYSLNAMSRRPKSAAPLSNQPLHHRQWLQIRPTRSLWLRKQEADKTDRQNQKEVVIELESLKERLSDGSKS